MEKLCKNCRWWGGADSASSGMYICEDYRQCSRVCGDDGIDWWADFSRCVIATSPDFGCIHWEPREDDDA